MVIEEIGVGHTLPNENSIGDVPKSSLVAGLIIKSNGVSDFFSDHSASLEADSAGHAHSSHSSGLGDDDIDLVDGFMFAILILSY